MPRKTYPRPGHSATGPAFLPGKTPRLVDSVEVAEILRRVSKRHFAGQKFCVRKERYSDDSSIDVVWTDGPALAQVEPHRGADFDGMRDLKTYRDAVVVGDDGTIERVRYGADVIFRKREASGEAGADVLARLSDELGEPVEELKLYPASYLRERDAFAHESVRDDDWRRSRESLETRPPLELQTRSER
jgi:hypothetical protein